MSDHHLLISIKTFAGQGTVSLKECVQQLSTAFQVERVSSVYKVKRMGESLSSLQNIQTMEELEGFALVVKVCTQKTPREALAELSRVERRLQREVLKRSVSFNLLIYDHEIVMLPDLSLPHPEMHLRPEEVIPSAELWPEYEHPVLKESLLQLSRRFANEKWGEFFTQGQPLLDF